MYIYLYIYIKCADGQCAHGWRVNRQLARKQRLWTRAHENVPAICH